MKTIVVSALGLLTQPNKYGVYPPGAMSIAKNVVMRDPGVLSGLPGMTMYASTVLTSKVAARLWPGDTHTLVISRTSGTSDVVWGVLSGGAVVAVASAPLGATRAVDTGRLTIASSRGRVFYNTTSDVHVLDAQGSATARLIGFRGSRGLEPVTASLTNAVSLQLGYQRRYRVLFRRISADGYVLCSAPTNALECRNTATGGVMDPNVRLIFGPLEDVAVAGDRIEVYRTKDQLIGVDPGDTYYLAKAHVITAADVTATFVTFRDATLDADLDEEMYTNPGADPLTRDGNYLPGQADDVVMHEGHAFYLTRKTNPVITLRPNGVFGGTLTTAADRRTGIGLRVVTGDTTATSADILNVSDMTGLQVGQIVYSTGGGISVSPQVRVTVIVGTTVTLSAAATITAVGTSVSFADALEAPALVSGATSLEVVSTLLNSRHVIASVPRILSFGGGGVPTEIFPAGGTYVLRLCSMNGGSSHTVRATNGQNYSPSLPLTSETAQAADFDERPNRWHISKFNEPDHVGINSKILVGSGTNYAGVSVGGVMLVFASDGLWQVSGLAGSWTIKSLDPTLILAARGCVGAMGGVAWAYTNRGLVAVSPDGNVQEISNGKIGQANAGGAGEFTGHSYADTWDRYLICDDRHREVLVTLDGGVNFFVYSARSDAFTTLVPTGTATTGVYSPALGSVMLTRTASTLVHLEYFSADSSATRMAGAQVRYQPLVGPDPSMTKEWMDIELAFEGVGTTMSLTPTFDATSYTAVSLAANSIESRIIVSVSRNAPALAARLAPGFTFASGETTNLWSLRMMAVTYQLAMEESMRR